MVAFSWAWWRTQSFDFKWRFFKYLHQLFFCNSTVGSHLPVPFCIERESQVTLCPLIQIHDVWCPCQCSIWASSHQYVCAWISNEPCSLKASQIRLHQIGIVVWLSCKLDCELTTNLWKFQRGLHCLQQVWASSISWIKLDSSSDLRIDCRCWSLQHFE